MKARVFLAACLAACGAAWGHEGHQPAKFNSLDITGSRCCRDIHLTDDLGQVRTLSDFRGSVVVIAFGYTHCPDVCPTTLADLAKARREMGADGQKVQVVFVTLDPVRDTGPVLRQYLDRFDRSFVALRGNEEDTAKVAEDFRIVVDKDKPDATGQYNVYHMKGTFVFDRSGRPRLFVSAERGDLLVRDIKRLLGEGKRS